MAIVRKKNGWYDTRKGQFVKAPKHVQEEVAAPAPAVEPEPVVQTLHEAPVQERVLTESEVEYHYGQEDATEETEE